MRTMTLKIMTVCPRNALRWNQFTHSFAQWQQRARSRVEFEMLNDSVLQDIGISRCTASFEACKPFWMA